MVSVQIRNWGIVRRARQSAVDDAGEPFSRSAPTAVATRTMAVYYDLHICPWIFIWRRRKTVHKQRVLVSTLTR